jgi:hypothetical protein
MKRNGPLNCSGPRSERKLRVAGKRSHSRSGSGRASPVSRSSPSLSKPAAPRTLLAGTNLTVVLRARGRSRFDALLDGVQIVKSSTQPICEAARVLHHSGYPDDCRLIARHERSDHHAIIGWLGYWRKRRIREDHGLPRYVAWEPLPRRVGAKKGHGAFKAVEHRATKKNSSTTAPGADERQSRILRRPRGWPRRKQS